MVSGSNTMQSRKTRAFVATAIQVVPETPNQRRARNWVSRHPATAPAVFIP